VTATSKVIVTATEVMVGMTTLIAFAVGIVLIASLIIGFWGAEEEVRGGAMDDILRDEEFDEEAVASVLDIEQDDHHA